MEPREFGRKKPFDRGNPFHELQSFQVGHCVREDGRDENRGEDLRQGFVRHNGAQRQLHVQEKEELPPRICHRPLFQDNRDQEAHFVAPQEH